MSNQKVKTTCIANGSLMYSFLKEEKEFDDDENDQNKFVCLGPKLQHQNYCDMDDENPSCLCYDKWDYNNVLIDKQQWVEITSLEFSNLIEKIVEYVYKIDKEDGVVCSTLPEFQSIMIPGKTLEIKDGEFVEFRIKVDENLILCVKRDSYDGIIISLLGLRAIDIHDAPEFEFELELTKYMYDQIFVTSCSKISEWFGIK
jgi:hypothetical protein